MAVLWTDDQKKVMTLRDRNLLVSAAAGSGKTAVLVQRILRKVTDPDRPTDIDRLLIMTFTRAAAGEMKERLSRALEEELAADPDNEQLLRQMNLIHTAQITTIDGFCAYVLRNYFHLIGLDPGFRIAEEGELTLIREDVMTELLEECYASGDPDFFRFVERFAPGKRDDAIGDLIQRIYDTSMSSPYPEKWLEECRCMYQVQSEEELEKSTWLSLFWQDLETDLKDCLALLEEAVQISEGPEGPAGFLDRLETEEEQVRELLIQAEKREFEAVRQKMNQLAFGRMPSKKVPDENPLLRKAASDKRSAAKKMLEEIRDSGFPGSLSFILDQIMDCQGLIDELVTLTEQFTERFAQAKEEKNILDFADLEHLTLQLLMPEEGSMSAAARELSERFDEILIDEYQDSNMVQEYIARAVSGWTRKQDNLFMVGDVKQSIYRFRQARPELFMEKYASYTQEESRNQRIDLHRNFRSRREVLDAVNFIFRQTMFRDLGGITYDDAAALYYGADFPEGPDRFTAEVLIVDKESPEFSDETGPDLARDMEALSVAQRIEQMVGKERIYDAKEKQMRPVRYGDIVVLLRTASGWAQAFSRIFSSRGIPNYRLSRTGYFSAPEVVCVLNYLRICANPRQDIPLAGVLLSPMAGLTVQEMASLRADYPDGLLYDSVLQCGGEKLKSFLARLEDFRIRSQYTPIHELILEILEETGYSSYVSVLPDGAQRKANLFMLVEKAKEFEKTSYKGLFSFIRYIEKLQKYEVDFGEVNVAADQEGCVQIMTIHKSKGLEFPVVFVAGLGKQFNFMDLRESVLTHPEYGMGLDPVDSQTRIRYPGFVRNRIARQLRKEMLGEELRILYVAMTRAREKLILSGCLGNPEKKAAELAAVCLSEDPVLPFRLRYKASSGWDMILPAIARHKAFYTVYEKYGIEAPKSLPFYNDPSSFEVHVVQPEELAVKDAVIMGEKEQLHGILKSLPPDRVYDPQIREVLEERFGYQYPWEYLRDLPVKYSVSELKKRSWHSEEEAVTPDLLREAVSEERSFASSLSSLDETEKTSMTAAQRGTAYHRFFECLDYSRTTDAGQLKAQLEDLVGSRKMTREQADCIRISDFERFLAASIGKRMKNAYGRGKLVREQPFVFSLPAREVDPCIPVDDPVLIQGIIDAYFLEEDGKIVLVDYKTDRVSEGQEQHLLDLYHIQLEEYAKALERLTGKPVKEKYLYSVALGREVEVS